MPIAQRLAQFLLQKPEFIKLYLVRTEKMGMPGITVMMGNRVAVTLPRAENPGRMSGRDPMAPSRSSSRSNVRAAPPKAPSIRKTTVAMIVDHQTGPWTEEFLESSLAHEGIMRT